MGLSIWYICSKIWRRLKVLFTNTKLRRYKQTGRYSIEITPRQLLFSALARHGGQVTRDTLVTEIKKMAIDLAKMGHKTNVVFKGCSGHWWNEDLDSEIGYWKDLVIEEPQPCIYKFAPKKEILRCYPSIEALANIVNANLAPEVQRFLLSSK